MSTFVVLLKKEILGQIRSKKLLVITFIFLFSAIGSPIFAKLMPQIVKSLSSETFKITAAKPTYMDSVAQFIKNISQLVVIVLVFVVAGAISDEKSKKTLELLLVKPVSKTSFVLSKFIGYFVTVISVYILGALIFYLYTVSMFSTFSFINFSIVAGFLLVYVLLIIATTIFASAISKANLLAGGLGFIGLIIYPTIAGIIPSTSKYLPNYVISNYQLLLNRGSDMVFLNSLFVSLSLIIVFMFLAVVAFNNQEIIK